MALEGFVVVGTIYNSAKCREVVQACRYFSPGIDANEYLFAIDYEMLRQYNRPISGGAYVSDGHNAYIVGYALESEPIAYLYKPWELSKVEVDVIKDVVGRPLEAYEFPMGPLHLLDVLVHIHGYTLEYEQAKDDIIDYINLQNVLDKWF